MTLFTESAATILSPVDESGNPRPVPLGSLQRWGTEVERSIDAFVSISPHVYDTRANLLADLQPSESSIAWVIADPTIENNGIYRKIGASGSGSWNRVGDLPYSFIRASNIGSGTANAIQATTSIPVPSADSGALITFNITTSNTGSPVTVSFNGGEPLTIKTASGNDIVPGGLVAGMEPAGYKVGSTFRLLSDQASAAIQALAQAWAEGTEPGGEGTKSAKEWAEESEGFRDGAEAARDLAAGYVNEIVSEKEVPIFATQAGMSALDLPAGMNRIHVLSQSSIFQVGAAADFVRVGGNPGHEGKFRTTDRYLPNEGEDLDDGGWWEIAEPLLCPEMFGIVDESPAAAAENTTRLEALLVAHSLLRRPIELPVGRTYYVSGPISTDDDYVHITGGGRIITDSLTNAVLRIGTGRPVSATKTLVANVRIGTKILDVGDVAGVQAGDIVRIVSNKMWYNDPRIDSDISANGFSNTQAGGTTTTAVLAASFAASASIIGKAINFASGPNAGFARTVTAYNDGAKTVTFTPALPDAVDAGVTYRFAEATKGQTTRVGRIIDGSTIETVDVMADGYFVADANPESVREQVRVDFYRPYSPVLEGFTVEGPDADANNFGVLVHRAADPVVKISVRNCRRAGAQISICHGGDVDMRMEGASDSSTGYGAQISNSAKVSMTGRGRNNRRLYDVSGTTPSDGCRIHGTIVDGGGLQEDGSAYWPLGSISNFGIGTHGPARGTIYENNQIYNVRYGIYERGRGAVVRNNTFGAGVQIPIMHSFGGRIEVYGNVVDPGIYDNISKSAERQAEVNGFGGDVTDGYAHCLLLLGANLAASQADASVAVRNNVARVKSNLVQIDRTGSVAAGFFNLSVYDNDVEFFPSNPAVAVALIGKAEGASGAGINLYAGQIGPNRMRTARENAQPLLYDPGANITLIASGQAAATLSFDHGAWSVHLANNSANWLPVPMLGRNRLLVSVSVEQTTSFHFTGWITRDSAEVIEIAAGQAEVMATAPTGSDGTNGRLQIHYGTGKLTIGNRLGAARTFNVRIW